MKLRPSPALVVAVLALVVALGGTSYAAAKIGSAQIKNNSVKGKDIKDGSLTGKDVRDSSLTGADVLDGSLTPADLAARTCPATTVPVLGSCVDRASNGAPTSFAAALAACDARNARLMTYQEYRVLVTKIAPAQWADGNPGQYELLDLPRANGAVVEPQALSYGGALFAPATGTNLFFRCVTAR